MHDRTELLEAIQNYAEEWKAGNSYIQSPAKTALCIALDRYEMTFLDRIHNLEKENDYLDNLLHPACDSY